MGPPQAEPSRGPPKVQHHQDPSEVAGGEKDERPVFLETVYSNINSIIEKKSKEIGETATFAPVARRFF